MPLGILGKKLGMTQVFDPDGNVVPVTVIEAGPCPVLKLKRKEGPDGYNAMLLGFEECRAKVKTKPELGNFKKWGIETPLRYLREFRLTQEEMDQVEEMQLAPGEVVTVDRMFSPGDRVDVTGTTKGRGFQGVVKRHNFAGPPKTRGTHEYRRHPGSIGCNTFPSRVLKGKKLPGHYGAERHTILNLQVVMVDPRQNLLLVRGGVPGATNSLVMVRRAVRTRKRHGE